jgi:hypothetical protein
VRPLAALSWLILAAACASPRAYNRTLLIDQLPAHARRMDVWHTLLAGGWCPMRGTPGMERFKKCDGSPPMVLRLTFYEDRLVHAVFVSFYRSPPRWDAPLAIPAVEPSRPPQAAEPRSKHVRMGGRVVAPRLAQDGLHISPSATHLESRMFDALAAELCRRYGPAKTRARQAHSGSSWQIGVWRPSPIAAVELVVMSGIIVETWAFAPWELHRVPMPVELRVARGDPESWHRQDGPLAEVPSPSPATDEDPLAPASQPPADVTRRVPPEPASEHPIQEPSRPARKARPAKPCGPKGRCPLGSLC